MESLTIGKEFFETFYKYFIAKNGCFSALRNSAKSVNIKSMS
jgi:hypothetical protein